MMRSRLTNDRGVWLVEDKERREAERMDMAWLKDYQEPTADEDDVEPDTPEE